MTEVLDGYDYLELWFDCTLHSHVVMALSSFENVSLVKGHGGVVGLQSSISCTSARCDSLLSRLVVTRCNFAACAASASGGAVFVVDATVQMATTQFFANVASRNGYGGAICLEGATRASIAADSRFSGNSAGWGGSIAALGVTGLVIGATTFENDFAFHQVSH